MVVIGACVSDEKEAKEQIAEHNRQCMPEIAALMDVMRTAFGARLIVACESGYAVGKGFGPKAVKESD